MPLAEDIKALALNAGFHAVGITGVDPFIASEQTLNDRINRGLLEIHGFNSNSARTYTHPQDSFPDARSIISVALSYLTDDTPLHKLDGEPRGWIAGFARGTDYHKPLQDRLLILASNIQKKLDVRAELRPFADTGPISDRSAAMRAGLGSRGKNTCVYAGDYGSWVVLGELLTDLELEADPPAALEACGECNKCMKACPTGAICAPYTIDVRICLSQVTQSKGFIPHWLREKMGARIYGCDTCQAVCPLNTGAKPGNVDALRPSYGIGANPLLIPLLNITPAEFNEQIRSTTAAWIRRTRFRRNVAIALGNIGDPKALSALTEALSDSEPIIRGHAAWALGKIDTPQSRLILAKALQIEADERVGGEIRNALEMHQ